MVDMTLSIERIYHSMVEAENYRMLSQFEYSWDETPLRSSRLSKAPQMTDVCIFVDF